MTLADLMNPKQLKRFTEILTKQQSAYQLAHANRPTTEEVRDCAAKVAEKLQDAADFYRSLAPADAPIDSDHEFYFVRVKKLGDRAYTTVCTGRYLVSWIAGTQSYQVKAWHGPVWVPGGFREAPKRKGGLKV